MEKIHLKIIDHSIHPAITRYEIDEEKLKEIESFLNQYTEPTEFFRKDIRYDIVKIVIGTLTYEITKHIWEKIKPKLIKMLQNTRKIPEN